MITETPQKPFHKPIIVAEHFKLDLKREDLDGAELITGRAVKSIDFGDWREAGGGTNPSPTDVERDVGLALGGQVRLVSRITEADGAMVAKFQRIEAVDKLQQLPQSVDKVVPVNRLAKALAKVEAENPSGLQIEVATGHPTDSDALARIQKQQGVVAGAHFAARVAKASAKSAKATWETECEKLHEMIELTKSEQNLPLVKRAEASANGKPKEDESWKKEPLKGLGLKPGVLKLLTDGELADGTHIGWTTVGELAAFVDKKGKAGILAPLTLIKGLKGAKLEQVDEAMIAFWKRRGEQAIAAESIAGGSGPEQTIPPPPTSADTLAPAASPPAEVPAEAEATSPEIAGKVPEPPAEKPAKVRGQKKPKNE